MKLHDLYKIYFIILTLFVISFQDVNAQTFFFKVIASYGNPVMLKTSDSKWVSIKAGEKILPGYKLKLEGDDYVGLINNNGRSLEVKQAGTYSSDELNKNVPKGSTNLQKFADFVMNESAANKKKSENMKNLGAVVRARVGQIETCFPDETDLLNLSLEPKWYSAGPGVTYIFKILNPVGRSVFIKETKDTSLTVDLKQFGILTEQSYSWCVINSHDSTINSDTSSFRVLTDNNVKITSDSLKMMGDNLDVNSAVGQFLLVKYLESKNLNYDALKGYELLIKNNPHVDIYNDNYLLFLAKQNLTKTAEKLLSTIKK